MKLLAEEVQVVPAFNPVNLATAANTGDWISMKFFRHLTILYMQGPGTAAEPATITVSQATAVAGTGSKGLATIASYYIKKAVTDLTGTGAFTKVTQTAASTVVLGVGAEGDKATLVLIEINAEDLDVEGGFDCVQASVGDVGTGPTIGCLFYLLSDARVQPPLSAIVD
jgi:hypothetical protein